jgi:hypothetical protein
MKHGGIDPYKPRGGRLSVGAIAGIIICFFAFPPVYNALILRTSGDLSAVKTLVSKRKEWFPEFAYIYDIEAEVNVSGSRGSRGIINWKSSETGGFYTFKVIGFRSYVKNRFTDKDTVYVRVSYFKNGGHVELGAYEKRFWFSSDNNDWPNKALVPTPASVTPAADAPVAPDAGAAHL